MTAGVPAFGGHSLGRTIEQSATLTHHEGRQDIESETFFVHGSPGVAGTLRHTDGGADVDHGMVGHLVAGTLNANGKAAGSATQQDAESGLLVVSHANAGGQVSITYSIQNATRVKAQNGLGISQDGDPMYTLDNGSQHAVCVTGDVTHTLKADGFDGSEDGTGRGQPIIAAISPTLRSANFRSHSNPSTQADTLVVASDVRRLVPRECERLQGMPDDYTLIPWRGKPASECPDGPRYKAIGNSKAVPCVRWIGRRILKQINP